MSVVKSKRNESRLEVLVQADRLAKSLTDLMVRDFGIKDPEMVARRKYAFGKDRVENASRYRFLISETKTSLSQDVRLLTYHIESANAIFPTTLSECDKRRELQDLALGNCAHIRHELQRFCDVFDVRIGDYRIPVAELDREVALLKKWRQKDSSVRRKLQARGDV